MDMEIDNNSVEIKLADLGSYRFREREKLLVSLDTVDLKTPMKCLLNTPAM